MTIIWCMVPEIWSMMNRIFHHFGLFFALYSPPPFPRTSQKIKILKNWKKCLEISFCTSVPKIMIICYTRDYFRNWGQHPKDTKRALFHYTKVSLFTLASIKNFLKKIGHPGQRLEVGVSFSLNNPCILFLRYVA